MKKLLLSIAALTMTAAVSVADNSTLVFDGDNDMYGLVRQNTTAAADLTFVKEWSFTENGIDFRIADTNENEESLGFALVNAGGDKAGIYSFWSYSMAKQTAPEITLTVPGGNISKIKLVMSGYAMSSLSLKFGVPGENPDIVESENFINNLYSWTWEASDTNEGIVNISWDGTFGERFIHSIEVQYTPDLGGKEPCGLSFSSDGVTAVMDENYRLPRLSNPNNLPIVWSSSNPAIATVDNDGAVTLLSGGKTDIIAATEGNDKYAAGNVKYELTVIPVASTLPKMLEAAPNPGEKVKVLAPLTVTFANSNRAFVIDPEGNACQIVDIRNENSGSSDKVPTLYKVGDILPAGWTATNRIVYESPLWAGIPDAVTETTEVAYPRVSAVTPADADRVVILKKVTFNTVTAVGNTKAYGTTPDGTRYEFQDTYDFMDNRPAGTYDVTCVVRYSRSGQTVYFWLAPLAYNEPQEDILPEFPEAFDITLSSGEPTIIQTDESNYVEVNVTGECESEELSVSFAVPSGWEGFVVREVEFKPVAEEEVEDAWFPLDEVLEPEGLVKKNSVTVPADSNLHIYELYLYYDGQLYIGKNIILEALITKKADSVKVLETADGRDARYFNLQGVEVSDPRGGIFVKVSDGKAMKVVIK